MLENIQQLLQSAYNKATNDNLPESLKIEAMKAYALLIIAERGERSG